MEALNDVCARQDALHRGVCDVRVAIPEGAWHTAAGAANIMSHILEVYFGYQEAYIPDWISEALLKTVTCYAPIAIREPEIYEARATVDVGQYAGA